TAEGGRGASFGQRRTSMMANNKAWLLVASLSAMSLPLVHCSSDDSAPANAAGAGGMGGSTADSGGDTKSEAEGGGTGGSMPEGGDAPAEAAPDAPLEGGDAAEAGGDAAEEGDAATEAEAGGDAADDGG